ncbi:Glucosidase II beta subunit-like domain containing protein [Amanita muscaria]
MLTWLLLLPLPATVLAGLDQTFGVHPSLLSKYVPSKSGRWRCLDGSKEIPWTAVNDDYCDCPDGSDEPGTSACTNSVFYCRNTGHIGATIPSSHVNDGLCEPQCCDGSDERPGVCPNDCKEVGEEYRKQRDAELRIQKTGAKIRSSYIAFAYVERNRLEDEAKKLSTRIADQEKEVTRLRDIADRADSLSAATLEHRKQSPLYQALINQANALKSLQREYTKLKEREQSLRDILDNLRHGYNPNYQDMAVLEAVRGWEQLAKLPHINDVGKEQQEATVEEAGIVPEEEEESLDDGAWSREDLETELDSLLKTDYESLLFAHEEHIDAPTDTSSLFYLANYIPDTLLTQYEELKDKAVSWLEKFGVISARSSTTSADSTRAHQTLTEAETTLKRLESDARSAQDQLSTLFDPEHFGAKGEWKKLENTCIETVTGDYTYEVCLFGEAWQKPLNGGTTFSLGRFASWDTSANPGEPAYYQKQVYKHGTRCWNGPERSVILLLSCGAENTLTSVIELQKCEYQLTATTPALCLPVEEDKNAPAKEEL